MDLDIVQAILAAGELRETFTVLGFGGYLSWRTYVWWKAFKKRISWALWGYKHTRGYPRS